MLWLYRFVFLPVLLVSSPYYLLRMKRRGGYRRHFRQRLGAVPSLHPKHEGVRRIWLQAVSVGEMMAIGPLLEAFSRDHSVEFYLTTTTSTGYKVAKERYHENAAGIGYFPIDWWLFSSRAWRRIAPDLIILTEGERWPEHVFQARKRGVPVVSINARLSDRSFRRMKRFTALSRALFHGISRVLASSEFDAARFREIGVDADRVTVTGNIKLDLVLPPLPEAQRALYRAQLGMGQDLILLGSSTWPGEEEALVGALRGLRDAGIACRLLLVPRHAERRKEIEALLKGSGFNYHFRTRGSAVAPVDIAVADTTGELRQLTHLADVVFVGKSLPPNEGGQTPVDAAALGKPIVFGPEMSNFRVLSQELLAAGGAQKIEDVAELHRVLIALFKDSARRDRMAKAALTWHRANQGALERTVQAIREELNHLRPPGSSAPVSVVAR